MEEEPPVNVHVMAGTGYVFNVDDILALRREHRIVGSLVGANPRFPSKDGDKGSPLMLLPEEMQLLKGRIRF